MSSQWERDLKDMEQIRIEFQIPFDEDRYLDRRCPWSECGADFKVQFDDWGVKVHDGTAYCPFCGYHGEIAGFNMPQQQAYINQIGLAEVQRRLGPILKNWARESNRLQPPRSGPLAISFRWDVRTAPPTLPLMPEVQEALTLRLACETCACRYAVIGAGYFCPACGHNSAGQDFDQTIASARATMAALPATRAAIPDRDLAAQVAAQLIESSIGNLVTAFQRFAEAGYPKLPGPHGKPRRNAFQNLTEGSDLWEKADGQPYRQHLDAIDYAELARLFQQRHVLAHQKGIVDADYTTKSGDTTYAVGQRLVIREAAVLRFAELLEALVAGMRRDLPS